MSHFCLLRDPDNYAPFDWDISDEPGGAEYCLELFSRHFVDTMGHAAHRYGRSANKRIEAAARDFTAAIDSIRQDPTSLSGGRISILALCRVREKALRDNGLPDPFSHIKDRENARALEVYPEIIRELRALDGPERWLRMMEGIFAGNIFDMGFPVTMNVSQESPDFAAMLERVPLRPWLVDDFDRLIDHLPHSAAPTRWTKAMFFVDNAGSDFVLGMTPMVRELAREGVQVVLAANEVPSLNDVTADETAGLIDLLAADDADLAALAEAGMIQVVSTGNDVPLIDLSEVSDELNEAAADADLVVLEGMGRAIETNFNTPLTVDCIRLALLKDPRIAAHIGGEVFDCVCKYVEVE